MRRCAPSSASEPAGPWPGLTLAARAAKPGPMMSVIVILAATYVVVVIAVCVQVGRDIDGSRGFLLALLLGPFGLLIVVLLRLGDRISTDLERLDESIGQLDHAMSSLMPWGRPRPRPKHPPE